jgi:hypothetical protein
MNKVLNISTALWILLRIQSIEKLLGALSSLKDGFYRGTIFRPKKLKMPFDKMFFSHARDSVDAPFPIEGDSLQS